MIFAPACVSSGLGRSTSLAWVLSGKGGQRVAGEAVDGPLRVRPGPESLVETDRILVPVEDRPFQARAATFHGDGGKAREQRSADASAAVRLDHEEVLEVDPGLGQERREAMKEQRKSDRPPVLLGEQRLGIRTWPEQPSREV